MNTFKGYQQKFHQALSDEIQSLRKRGGQTTTVTNGQRLGIRNGSCIYSFSVDTELRFPDDTPIDIIYQKERRRGMLLSVEGFDLVISVDKYFGEKISSAKISTEPWFLLEALQERLSIALISKQSNNSLAEALLSDKSDSVPLNSESFYDFISKIEGQIKTALNYNQYQAEAITHVLQHPVSFIWGPPGTGKTSTLGLTAASLVHSGQQVLILAHSNAAIDTAMRSVAKYLYQSSYYKEGFILRFGIDSPDITKEYPLISIRGIAQKQNSSLIEAIKSLEKQRRQLTKQSRSEELNPLQKDEIKKQILTIKTKIQPLKQQLKQKESELVRKAMVVGCTLSKATIAKEIYERQFDAVIIDEASMAYIPHCFYAATLARKRIAIFGDFRQLGPISQAGTEETETWLQRDIFEEAGIINSFNRGQTDERLILLQTQYRMYPSISEIPNKLFYDEKLQDWEGIREQNQDIVDAPPNSGNALIFYDLSQVSAFCFKEKESHSRFNIISALIATSLSYQSLQTQSGGIGIITPYNAQARLLHRLLRETHLDNQLLERVKVATVHKFQGSEKALIIFDAVDSYPQTKAGLLLSGGRLSTAARLSNVAISRAQGKFIGLFSYNFFQKCQETLHIFRLFIERLRAKSLVLLIQFENLKSPEFALPGVKIYNKLLEAKSDIQQDILSAKQTVAVDWPITLDSQRHFTLIKDCPEINWIIRGINAEKIALGLKNCRVWKLDSFSEMGVVGIDQKILWIYPKPNSESSVFRINLPNTVQLLHTFLELIPGDIVDVSTNKWFGICEICNQPLWPQHDGYGGFRVVCLNHKNQGRKITVKDATTVAQINKAICEECYCSLQGAGNREQLFLVCSNKKCNWKRNLKDLI
jgi:hypothetical protein